MCLPGLFGGRRNDPPPAPPVPAPPSTPPPPQPVQTAPTPMPEAPTPAPVEDETKKKAKVKAKKVAKKAAKQGTTQLATKKPKTGGLQGITTPQGTNTASGGGAGGSYS